MPDEHTVIDDIRNVLKDPKIMADPQRPVISYGELMQNIISDDDGWTIYLNGVPVLFVHGKTGHELLHETIAEFAARYNGAAIDPRKHHGFRV
jgi:hypothetical protein